MVHNFTIDVVIDIVRLYCSALHVVIDIVHYFTILPELTVLRNCMLAISHYYHSPNLLSCGDAGRAEGEGGGGEGAPEGAARGGETHGRSHRACREAGELKDEP